MNQNKFDNLETSRLCSKCWMKIFWLKKLSNFINYKEEETMNYNYYIVSRVRDTVPSTRVSGALHTLCGAPACSGLPTAFTMTVFTKKFHIWRWKLPTPAV